MGMEITAVQLRLIQDAVRASLPLTPSRILMPTLTSTGQRTGGPALLVVDTGI